MSKDESRNPFDKLLNFRDVGQFINRSASQQLLKPGLFFRSARPDEASQADRDRLRTEFGIRTIIDLRTDTELVEQNRKLAARKSARKSAAAPSLEDSDPQGPLRVPGINYQNVNLNGSAYSKSLIKKLTWGQTAKLAALYTCGYRTDAIAVLGSNVMALRGLIGLTEDTLLNCTAEISSIFKILADGSAYPILVHCTQGKDRTGIVVLLVLLLLNAPITAIDEDYMKTQPELVSEREDRLREISAIGLPDSFADCDPAWVKSVTAFIDDKLGGVEQYLTHCGVSEHTRQTVRGILTM